jgi:hypothetical protein
MTASRNRIIAARVLAVVADAVQLALIPLFAPGAASPVNDALDVAVGIAMVALVGWHWSFVPAFVAELVPFADLAPSWTIAVLVATRRPTPPRSSAPHRAPERLRSPDQSD